MCDLFYLPFEHGPQSVQYLTEFNWLKSNAHLVSKENQQKSKKSSPTESKPEVSLLQYFEYLNFIIITSMLLSVLMLIFFFQLTN